MGSRRKDVMLGVAVEFVAGQLKDSAIEVKVKIIK